MTLKDTLYQKFDKPKSTVVPFFNLGLGHNVICSNINNSKRWHQSNSKIHPSLDIFFLKKKSRNRNQTYLIENYLHYES